MSNVVSIYADKRITNFYEVTDASGIAMWGGGSIDEAIKWLRMPEASKIYVSAWETDSDDARMLGEPIEITSFFKAIVREYGGY